MEHFKGEGSILGPEQNQILPITIFQLKIMRYNASLYLQNRRKDRVSVGIVDWARHPLDRYHSLLVDDVDDAESAENLTNKIVITENTSAKTSVIILGILSKSWWHIF